jgi:hypothetical protein
MPLNKAQLMDVPGGPGVVGAIKAGTGISVSPDGTISVNAAENVTKLVAGDNCTLTPASGLGEVTITFTGGGGSGPDVPSGTVMPFFQPTAPTGWTKQSTYDDYAIRVVSGVGGATGGNLPFSQVFTNVPITGTVSVTGISVAGNVGATSLSVAQIGAHTHTVKARGSPSPVSFQPEGNPGTTALNPPVTSSSAGSGQGHTHSFGGTAAGGNATFTSSGVPLAVRYVDCILCTKN